jgi:catechol 2,3-dioxygenase-like lactoylglutathione lyase family enzyme
MRSQADPARCFPVLASLNIKESRAFYVEQLGFADVVYEAENYLIVRRQDMELHFWPAPDRIHSENTSCYIRGGQIADLHAEFAARDVPGLSAFKVMPWDMKEFTIHDPHGNLLRFGAAPQELDGD